jgi:signal transduction histidine kinase
LAAIVLIYGPLFFIVFTNSGTAFIGWNPDEVLQMVAFILYIHFAAFALDMNRERDKYAFHFARITPYLVLLYIAVNTFIINAYGYDVPVFLISKITVRFYLLLIGSLMLLVVIRKRREVFYRYLAAGAISMIVCGLISSLLNILAPDTFLLGAISWLMFGFLLDVVFFSAAIGYKMRQEHTEKETSLKMLLLKEAELQQLELEKMKLAYETREEERRRIARDLHDDMGSTLSSINIYANVVSSYMETNKSKAHLYLEKIQKNTKQLLENTTDLIWSLQTNYGEAESIFKRMQKTAIELLSSGNIAAQIDIREEELPSLHIAAQKNCWLIFKEAVNNVCKYSKANNCHISIKQEDGNLIMTITDDGVGFEHSRKGNGLENMNLRALELTGTFSIKSRIGSGTTTTVIFPLEKVALYQ